MYILSSRTYSVRVNYDVRNNDTNKLFIVERANPQARPVERKGERPPPDVTGQDFPRMFRNKFRGRNTAAARRGAVRRESPESLPVPPPKENR